jgi:RNA polymerase primary sigma factor
LRHPAYTKPELLTEPEAAVIRMRFGIDIGGNCTPEETTRHMDVSRERVRPIEAKAMRKLKHLSQMRRQRNGGATSNGTH